MDQSLILSEGRFLSEEQIDLLNGLKDIQLEVPRGATKFQIEMFLLQTFEHPTWYSVLYQATVECQTKVNAITQNLQELRRSKLKAAIKKARIKKLKSQTGLEDEEINLAQAELFEYDLIIQVENNEYIKRDILSRFRELLILQKIRIEAKKHCKAKWGDDEEEAIQWYIKFVMQGCPMRSSLVAGKMKDIEPMVAKYFATLTEAERKILGVEGGVLASQTPKRVSSEMTPAMSRRFPKTEKEKLRTGKCNGLK